VTLLAQGSTGLVLKLADFHKSRPVRVENDGIMEAHTRTCDTVRVDDMDCPRCGDHLLVVDSTWRCPSCKYEEQIKS
jgi:predicted Zn-ribbon and HTH transcriptional regulator